MQWHADKQGSFREKRKYSRGNGGEGRHLGELPKTERPMIEVTKRERGWDWIRWGICEDLIGDLIWKRGLRLKEYNQNQWRRSSVVLLNTM
jgi:hypothetical protein